MKPFDTSIYFITDSTAYGEDEFLRRVDAALQGGVSIVQIREKNKSTRAIVDDRVDVALAVDAEGVHLGAEDMTVAAARRILGDEKIIGATAKTVPWARDAAAQGADYLGVGAIYPTTTKVKTVLTSVETLREICMAVDIPVNAIGGLNRQNIDVLAGIPIAGICAVSAIMKAEDPKTAAEELRARAKEVLFG